MKRSAGDEDGPGQKRLVRRHEGQARGSAATARMIFPPFPPLMPWIKETMWSGTLEFKNRPHSNDQRQDVDIISCKIDTIWGINTDNWPKQLKMTTITKDDSFVMGNERNEALIPLGWRRPGRGIIRSFNSNDHNIKDFEVSVVRSSFNNNGSS